jgi:hypothetical protein
MDLGSIIGLTSGGGILGIFGGLANSWLQLKAKKQDNEFQLSSLRLRADVASVEGEAKAFTASQESAKADGMPALPRNASPALMWITYGTQALRTATRPLLTWALVAAALWKPEMSGLAAVAVTWWFGSRSTAFFGSVERK